MLLCSVVFEGVVVCCHPAVISILWFFFCQVQGNSDDEEGGDVTYTTVKASSTDPSCLYATVK